MSESEAALSALILAYKAVEDACKTLSRARDACRFEAKTLPARSRHQALAHELLQADDDLFQTRLDHYANEIRRLPLDSAEAVLQRMRFEAWEFDERPLGPEDIAAITAAYDRYVLKLQAEQCLGKRAA